LHRPDTFCTRVRIRSGLLSQTRDEEIAKLEEQLRQLRENEANNDSIESNSVSRVSNTSNDPDDVATLKEFEAARRRLEKVKGKDMLLTEQQLIKGGLIDDENSNSLGNISVIAIVVAAVIGLFVFAQIPVGQDELARYSATGSSTIKSIDLGDINPDVNRL
jgi:hypothetical protein